MDRKLFDIQMTSLKRAVEHLQTLDLDGMLQSAKASGASIDAESIELARRLIADLPDAIKRPPPL
jgi:hypothetical protein